MEGDFERWKRMLTRVMERVSVPARRRSTASERE
jgi:hypothetical protein